MAKDPNMISVVRAKPSWRRIFQLPASKPKKTEAKSIVPKVPPQTTSALEPVQQKPIQKKEVKPKVEDSTVKTNGIITGKLIPEKTTPWAIITIGPLVVIALLLAFLLWTRISGSLQ